VIERLVFPHAPWPPAQPAGRLERAIEILHLVAGVSY
jgi:hypothetical protein